MPSPAFSLNASHESWSQHLPALFMKKNSHASLSKQCSAHCSTVHPVFSPGSHINAIKDSLAHASSSAPYNSVYVYNAQTRIKTLTIVFLKLSSDHIARAVTMQIFAPSLKTAFSQLLRQSVHSIWYTSMMDMEMIHVIWFFNREKFLWIFERKKLEGKAAWLK